MYIVLLFFLIRKIGFFKNSVVLYKSFEPIEIHFSITNYVHSYCSRTTSEQQFYNTFSSCLNQAPSNISCKNFSWIDRDIHQNEFSVTLQPTTWISESWISIKVNFAGKNCSYRHQQILGTLTEPAFRTFETDTRLQLAHPLSTR